MEALEVGCIVILGLIFGSFLNVLILRLRKNMTLFGRSQCTNCQTTLPAKHLVPVLSWIALRGRCAFCRHPIHIQYPLVELASAILLLFAYVRHPVFAASANWPVFIVESCFLLFLLALVVFDLRWKLLPIEPIAAATLAFAVWNIMSGTLPWTSVIVGALVGGGFLGVQVLLSRGRAVKYADHLRECNKRARRVAMDAFEHYRKVCKFPRSSALFADCLETVLQDAALRELGGESR
jgi:prepilin signal peptidase PulO-like enzyme (type II secretory pathway)